MLKLFKDHTLFITYVVVFGGLLYGVYLSSGTKYLSYMWLYFLAFALFYMVFNLAVFKRIIWSKIEKFSISSSLIKIQYFAYFSLVAVVVHLVYLKGSPAMHAMQLNYVEDVAILRNQITDNAPTWLGYLSAFTIRAFLPFLVMALVIKNKKYLYWIVLLVAVFYSFSLMQKSYIVGILLPAMIYTILNKKWWYVLKYIALNVIVVFGLSFVANPAGGSNPNYNGAVINGQTIPVDNFSNANDDDISFEELNSEVNSQKSMALRIAHGLLNRLTVVPGWVVSGWFNAIPQKKPFLMGDGYRILALLRGHTYHNYSKELYPIIQPGYAAQGLTGTVNVASFMYEYSNFGSAGMVLSGFVLALLLLTIETLFKNAFKFKISINIFPILLLSSGAITTLLFSGGWGLMIFLYFVYLKNPEQ